MLAALLLAQAEGWLDALRSDDVEQRRRAERSLLEAGPSVQPHLETLRDDPDPERRAVARRLLDLLKIRAALPPSIEAAYPRTAERLVDGHWRAVFEAFAARRSAVPQAELRAATTQVMRVAQRLGAIEAFGKLAGDTRAGFAAPSLAVAHREASHPDQKESLWDALRLLVGSLFTGSTTVEDHRQLSVDLRIPAFGALLGDVVDIPFTGPLTRYAVLDDRIVHPGERVPELGVLVERIRPHGLDLRPLAP